MCLMFALFLSISVGSMHERVGRDVFPDCFPGCRFAILFGFRPAYGDLRVMYLIQGISPLPPSNTIQRVKCDFYDLGFRQDVRMVRKKGTTENRSPLSLLVAGTGFEPVTFGL